MMRTLPLGVDIGASRLRIVCAQTCGGTVKVTSVAVRNLASVTATSPDAEDAGPLCDAISDAWSELGTRERRCVLALGMPEAQLHCAELALTTTGRASDAAAEAHKHIDYPMHEAVVRVHPLDRRHRRYALGVIRATVLRARLAALTGSPLRAIALDHESLALRRALPEYDAVVDIGLERSSLHAYDRLLPVTLPIAIGGEAITREIERELAIDARTAEHRKRVHGVYGAGEAARDRLIAAVITHLDALDPRGRRLLRIALVGNGARLRDLGPDLERLCSRRVEVPASATLRGGAYPPDVVAGAAPDWNLAAGLSLWSVAA